MTGKYIGSDPRLVYGKCYKFRGISGVCGPGAEYTGCYQILSNEGDIIGHFDVELFVTDAEFRDRQISKMIKCHNREQ